MLRGSRGDAAGTELGSSFVERITVNVGTVPVLARLHVSSCVSGWVHRRPIGSGRGGAVVVVGGRGKPVHKGKGGSSFKKVRRLNAERRATEWWCSNR